ncbi:histidine kinase [Cytophagaceae bacterium YF14B1]|uniref:Histidine kinase n=1 Tax=Xanthocytophaga flava TaxID=3048013 RepID=A0AAE3QPU1_9BACT|nr:histidine kinase [Xanthocytophaga flavus]MDJ1480669.1 histidine kinase [Xanthocytophaga flavus]
MAEKFTYSFRVKWTTLLGVFSFGILVPTFFVPVILGSEEHFLWIFVATLISFVIWEGSKLIQALILYFYPWEKSIIKHLSYEVASIFVFSSLVLIVGLLTYNALVSEVSISISVVLQNIFVSFLLALLFIAINEGAFLFGKWKASLLEQERLRQENLIAKVESLKKQLDPHFLFNSLSVLSGVVYKDPVLADRFITKLAQVYRYVLEHNDEKQVPLQKEISVVEAYCFLLNVRFYNKVLLDVKIAEKPVYVLPLSIQLLVENAVKHNRISDTSPLELKIYTADNTVWVENTLNKKDTQVESTGIGLKNLEARYKYVIGKSIQVEDNGQVFKVGLPLLTEEA